MSAPKVNPSLRRYVGPIAKLKEDPGNAKKHSVDQVGRIAKSLAAFGQQLPVVRAADGTILAGNGTYLAAKLLGWDAIASIPFKGSAALARVFKIADNRSGELSEWDNAKLAKQLGRGGADLDSMGFTKEEADMVKARAEEVIPDAGDEPPADEEKPRAWTAQVRMVQLVYTAEQHARFIAAVKALAPAYKTSNVTDTVVEAMRRASVG